MLLGIFLIWYSFKDSTAQDRESLWQSIVDANKLWIFASFLLGAISHFSRAYRWKFMLEPLGFKPKYTNSVLKIDKFTFQGKTTIGKKYLTNQSHVYQFCKFFHEGWYVKKKK